MLRGIRYTICMDEDDDIECAICADQPPVEAHDNTPVLSDWGNGEFGWICSDCADSIIDTDQETAGLGGVTDAVGFKEKP